ncbi:MAG TPA: hypothetical protein VKZ84_06195, partial [Bacteriovoracaceae bacterium]|nr:hypothetical protein [Bacteriovoracaceae bacterium]
LLEQRLKEEQDLNDFVSERITWLTAVALMYTVAAGLAIMEETQGIAAGVVAANTACTGIAATQCAGSGPGYPACYAAKYAMCVMQSPTGWAAANGASSSPTSVKTGTSASKSTGVNAPAALGYLTSYLAGAYAGCTPMSAGNVSVGPFSANLISIAYGMGFSMGENSMVGYVKLATAILNALIPGIKQLVVASYNYPIPRAITFGISAGLVAAIIADLNKIKSQTEGNIEEISKVVDDFKLATTDHEGMKQGTGSVMDSNGEMNNSALSSVSPNANKSLKVGNDSNIAKLNPMETSLKNKQCFSNEKGNLSYDSASCSKAARINPVVVKVKGGHQSSLKTAAGLINEIANDLASGNKNSANVKMGQLNSMAASIHSEVAKLKTDYNKAQKKNKKDTLDFDKAIANEMKKYEDLYERSKEMAFNDDPQLASLGGAQFFGGGEIDLDPAKDESTQQNIKESSAAEAIALSSGSDLSSAALAAENLISEGPFDETTNQLDENDFLYGGDKTSNNPFGLNEEAFRAATANGYMHLHGKNGYSAGEGVASQKENLFKIISNRYFLSYPKVMRKKITEGAVTE